jgi:SAM-dependent methyltransferase
VSHSKLAHIAGRVPRRVRRKVPTRLRNALVERYGHPVGAPQPEAFDPVAYPRRVNLGCGFDTRPGYLNVDLHGSHGPDLVADVRSLPQLPSGYYEEVLARDILEHLPRLEGPAALAEWRRLLAPGGRLWLRVPDVPSLLKWLADSDDADRHRQILHLLFGTQAYNGDFHQSGFTDVLLCDELRRLGLERITAQLRDEWLWELEAYAPGGDPALLVAVFWGSGFQPREADDKAAFRWSAEHSEAMLYAFEGPVDVELALTVDRGAGELVGCGATAALEPGDHRLALALQPGPNRLRFRSERRNGVTGAPSNPGFRLRAATIAAADGRHARTCL